MSMKAWLRLLKARILLLCAIAAVVVGIAPVLYLLGLLAWQVDIWLNTRAWIALPAALAFSDRALLRGGELAPVLAFIPHLPQLTLIDWTWSTNEVAAQILRHLHIGVIPGLIGCAMMTTGISTVLRQRVLIRIHKQRRKDPVQPLDDRVTQPSRADVGFDGRREPVIDAAGFAPSPANDTAAPQPAAQTAEMPGGSSDTDSSLERTRQLRACRQARARPVKRRAAA
jgi:hypothetical protein